MQEPKSLVLRIVEEVLNKQAIDPVALEVKGISTLCDYFVVCSAQTGRQVEAIAQGLSKCPDIKVSHVESDTESSWVMVDCLDVVVHIFTEELRARYNLEELWKAAKKIYPAAQAKKKAVSRKTVKRPVKKATKKIVKKTVKRAAKKAVSKKKQLKVVSRKKKSNHR